MRNIDDMKKFKDRNIPEFYMHPVKYENGSYGVEFVLSGLDSEQEAVAAMKQIELLFDIKQDIQMN